MDGNRFDQLARLLVLPGAPTRRALSSTLAGALAGALAMPGHEAAAGRAGGKRRKHRQARERRARSDVKKGTKVTVCHQGQTIMVPRKKKKLHLRHGDTSGPCPAPTTSPPTTRPPGACIPVCAGKTCGDDGCGKSCPPGCAGNDVCLNSQCVCQPQCDNRECGDNGCGATCGSCDPGESCSASGRCTCAPACDNRECGNDGCDGTCGICDPGETCSVNGRCGCEPDCGNRVCGDDGCGGSCPPGCAANEMCDNGACVCRPDCRDRACGNDGCNGSCGTCGANERCTENGVCRCEPDCTNKVCGSDGCDGICGQCVNNHDCLNGQCVCNAPATLCGDMCANLQSDWANCGDCGAVCDVENGAGWCNEGECAVSYCYGAWRDCDGQFATGCETDTHTSSDHCGACGRSCTGVNATGVCENGICRFVCDDGFARCDSNPQDGCPTDLRTSVFHCGECNHRCTYPTAKAVCVDGACQMGACKQRGDPFPDSSAFSWGDCDGDPSNGCEVDIMNSSAHCGACNQPCPDGQVCFDGVCELPCGAGGPCRVFRTFDGYRGNMGGLAAADALCQQQATAWHFPGVYMAWLSNETESPDTRFLLKSSGPYWTAGRQLIANNWADLTSSDLEHAIGSALYPFEGCRPPGEVAWSNTRADGTSRGADGLHCQNWSSIGSQASDAGSTGQCGVTTSKWTEGGPMTCSVGHGRLICFQQS